MCHVTLLLVRVKLITRQATVLQYENSSATLLKYVVVLAALSYSPAVLDNTLCQATAIGQPKVTNTKEKRSHIMYKHTDTPQTNSIYIRVTEKERREKRELNSDDRKEGGQTARQSEPGFLGKCY